jgi:chemotaxis protein methyltransferase CheR
MSEMLFRNVRIHATDVDGQFGPQVVSGVFPEGELQRIPGDLFERYFRPADQPGCFQVVEEIRSRVRFERHDLLSLKPVRENVSLVVCKNVLLHFSERQREDVLRMFHAAMREDGLLVMEHTQKMPETLRGLFVQTAPNAQVYRRIEVPAAALRGRLSGAAARVDLPEGKSLPRRGRQPHVLSGG